MLKIIWLILSLFLILLVLIRIPNSGGITNFSINNNLIGSSNSTERFLNKLTWLFITLYFLLALKFNIYI
jgi:protein translocase SecG subunit|uniref:Probable protein-export membrane protein SecG n=1 Tax=Coscinodiscus wailesii TaxID=671091 RepID=A0A8A6KGN0_9STRA|nr:Preprotein translocase SecG subunit [Coscinodiscus wailesii]QTI82844.1 Preprotein translocase SecG subunit [Coscinodiscus wailesii]